jgi:negative elongation factor B
VLRLFLAAASQMSAAYLAQCLETTLHISRRSRKHHKRRRTVIEYEYEPGGKSSRPRAPQDAGSAGYSSPGGYGSGGATGGYSSASDGSTFVTHGKVCGTRAPCTP